MSTAPAVVYLDDLQIPERMRAFDADKVGALARSITAVGLQYPIAILREGNVLITGRHRVAAYEMLGKLSIPCAVFDSEQDAKLWEISENLHRAELTPTERAEHVAEWIRLTTDHAKVSQIDSPKGGKQPKDKGTRKAAKELGITQTEAQRSVTIAEKLSPEAKAAAKEQDAKSKTKEGKAAGIKPVTQQKLLKAAKHKTAAKQIAALQELTEESRIERTANALNAFEDPVGYCLNDMCLALGHARVIRAVEHWLEAHKSKATLSSVK